MNKKIEKIIIINNFKKQKKIIKKIFDGEQFFVLTKNV